MPRVMLEKVDCETYIRRLEERGEQEYSARIVEILDRFRGELLTDQIMVALKYEMQNLIQEAKQRGFDLSINNLQINGSIPIVLEPKTGSTGWYEDDENWVLHRFHT
jgi:hypothetical protein